MSTVSSTPAGGPGAPAPDPDRWRRRLTTGIFLAPAAVLLTVWLVYPPIKTLIRSFFDARGHHFVWFDNYKAIFTTDTLETALKNNALWVLVVPALVTAIGLIFAVLIERIRWQVAFRIAIFMPMAISLFAAGVIWRIMDDKDPQKGAINASISVVKGAFSDSGVLAAGAPSTTTITGTAKTGLVLTKPVAAGGSALLGLTAIPPADVPSGAKQAVVPAPAAGTVGGTIWRDFKPGGGV